MEFNNAVAWEQRKLGEIAKDNYGTITRWYKLY